MRTLPPRRFRRLAVSLAVTGAAGLAVAGTASAMAPPGVSTPASPTKAAQLTFNVTAAIADPGYEISGYTYQFDGGPATAVPAVPGPVTVLGVGTGTHTLSVTATQTQVDALALPAPPSATATSDPVLVDQIVPTIAPVFTGLGGAGGFFRSAKVTWNCDDAGGSLLDSCPAAQNFVASGSYSPTGVAADKAGNQAQATVPAFAIDADPPPAPALTSPSNNAVVAAEPTFVWPETQEGGAVSSGTVGYRVYAKISGTFRLIAVTGGLKSTSTGRQPEVYGPALPLLTPIEWYVLAEDQAGNLSAVPAARRTFQIDPSIPPGPAITSGPGPQTNDTTPSFVWTGTQPTFEWTITPAGSDTPVQQGAGATSRADSGLIGPGDYTFQVRQVSAAGVKSQETTYAFTLDTAAPIGPVITGRPISPTKLITATFAWTGETHATYNWRVLGAGGRVMQSDSTKATTVTLKPLTPGAYSFLISQTDRAGNTSAVVMDPFSIIGPSGISAGRNLSLPTTNHRKLRPRRGLVVPTRKPVLRWTSGPRATTVYNVQVFRVMTRAKGKPKVAKILSAFPRAVQYRIPYSKTRPGACYVWRVWPYLGTRFTPKPLGISNFCIAGKATLRKVAQRKALQRQAAAPARAAGSTTAAR